MFYLILSHALWKRMFLLTLELGRISSFHPPSIHSPIHPYMYLLSNPCVTGVGGRWWRGVCPHGVDCPVRKTHIKKWHFKLRFLVITCGVYCNNPLVCNLCSQQNICCKTLPWVPLGFGKAETASGLCTRLCIPAVTLPLSTAYCDRLLSHGKASGDCWEDQRCLPRRPGLGSLEFCLTLGCPRLFVDMFLLKNNS